MLPLHLLLGLAALPATTAIPEGRRKWAHGFGSWRDGSYRSSHGVKKTNAYWYSHAACGPKIFARHDMAVDPFSSTTLSLDECSEACESENYFIDSLFYRPLRR
ncbi:hypothetical protein QBC37DRAFT_428531, partial [Rhypophila decipiens]